VTINEPTPAAELPSVASEAKRHLTNETPGAMGIKEAAEEFDVSVRTLRRRLGQHAVENAFQVPGPAGEEWRIPIQWLEAHYHRVPDRGGNEKMAPGHEAAGTSVLVDQMRSEIDHLHGEVAYLRSGEERAQTQLTQSTQTGESLRDELVESKIAHLAAVQELKSVKAMSRRQLRRWTKTQD